MKVGNADSITEYNKGIGLYSFLYYNPRKDSAILQTGYGESPVEYKTYVGKFRNRRYVDTILTLINFLKQYPNGSIPNRIPEGWIYDGPEYLVEFKDSKGIHNYEYILDGQDTLEQFSLFYSHLEYHSWKRKVIPYRIINNDSEVVNAIKRAGLYEKIVTPYIPLPCNSGIDLSKILGSWRSTGGFPSQNRTNFTKITIQKSGNVVYEEIREGISEFKRISQIRINPKDNTFTIITEKAEYKYIILNLTDNCFQYKGLDDGYTQRYDRLKQVRESSLP